MSEQQQSSIRYKPRNDMVLIRMERVEQVGQVFMPEASVQGYRYRIEAIGPKVESLNVGDVVIVTGQVGVDIGPLPNDSKLYLCREQNAALVIEPAEPEKILH